MSVFKEFKSFLVKQNALALAIGVVVGGALDTVVKGIVGGLIMPLVTFALPKDQSWQTYKTPGPIAFEIGNIANAVLSFVVIGFVAWRLSKLFAPEVLPTEKPATKMCPYCFKEDLDARAVRCPHCTMQLAAGAPDVAVAAPDGVLSKATGVPAGAARA